MISYPTKVQRKLTDRILQDFGRIEFKKSHQPVAKSKINILFVISFDYKKLVNIDGTTFGVIRMLQLTHSYVNNRTRLKSLFPPYLGVILGTLPLTFVRE